MFYQELPLQRQKRKPRLHLVRRRGVKEVRVTPVKVATGILPLTFLEPVTTWQDMCANSWKRCWRWYTIHIGISTHWTSSIHQNPQFTACTYVTKMFLKEGSDKSIHYHGSSETTACGEKIKPMCGQNQTPSHCLDHICV